MSAMIKGSIAARGATSSFRRCCPVTSQRIAPIRAVKLEKEADQKAEGVFMEVAGPSRVLGRG